VGRGGGSRTGPATIAVVFLVLGLANTAARLPAGWLIDRPGRPSLYAVGGVVMASLATALLPHVRGQTTLLVLIGIFGVASGLAFVAISVGFTAASAPAVRGGSSWAATARHSTWHSRLARLPWAPSLRAMDTRPVSRLEQPRVWSARSSRGSYGREPAPAVPSSPRPEPGGERVHLSPWRPHDRRENDGANPGQCVSPFFDPGIARDRIFTGPSELHC
jgi:hypothetical protein